MGQGAMTARRTLDRAMSERQLLDAVIEAALRLGWRVAHIPDDLYALAATTERYEALSGAKGFPDLILVRDGELIVAELKAERGQLSDEQQQWLSAFHEVRYQRGIRVFLWRPRDWSNGHIEAVLR